MKKAENIEKGWKGWIDLEKSRWEEPNAYARKLFTWRNHVASTLSTAVFCWKNTKSWFSSQKGWKKAENQDFPVFDRKTAVLVARLLQVIKILFHWVCPSPLEFFESLFSFFSLFSLFWSYRPGLNPIFENFAFRGSKIFRRTLAFPVGFP